MADEFQAYRAYADYSTVSNTIIDSLKTHPEKWESAEYLVLRLFTIQCLRLSAMVHEKVYYNFSKDRFFDIAHHHLSCLEKTSTPFEVERIPIEYEFFTAMHGQMMQYIRDAREQYERAGSKRP